MEMIIYIIEYSVSKINFLPNNSTKVNTRYHCKQGSGTPVGTTCPTTKCRNCSNSDMLATEIEDFLKIKYGKIATFDCDLTYQSM